MNWGCFVASACYHWQKNSFSSWSGHIARIFCQLKLSSSWVIQDCVQKHRNKSTTIKCFNRKTTTKQFLSGAIRESWFIVTEMLDSFIHFNNTSAPKQGTVQKYSTLLQVFYSNTVHKMLGGCYAAKRSTSYYIYYIIFHPSLWIFALYGQQGHYLFIMCSSRLQFVFVSLLYINNTCEHIYREWNV